MPDHENNYCPLHQTHENDIKDVRADISKIFLRVDMAKDRFAEAEKKILENMEGKVNMKLFIWVIGVVVVCMTGIVEYASALRGAIEQERVDRIAQRISIEKEFRDEVKQINAKLDMYFAGKLRDVK